jgi:hypothetical protein
MDYLIGIDDTDNETSRGTGFRARCMGAEMERLALGERLSITRHQLLVDPRIRYTSHNSAACLLIRSHDSIENLIGFCRDYLVRESAEGSDTGLCIVPCGTLNGEVALFSRAAKEKVLHREHALSLAQQMDIYLEGLTGDHGGVIGALAAVGLRAGGNDGRYIWAQGLRELQGVQTVESLCRTTGIDCVRTLAGESPPAPTRINTDPWPRPVLLQGEAVLLVERAPQGVDYEWQLLPKEIIRRY